MRIVSGAAFVLLATACFAADGKAKKQESPVLAQTMETLSGQQADLAKYKGKVLLIVNVASQCGATPQYEGLQKLYDKHKEKGLVVLGFPCNQFGSQEPGTAEEIAQFCKENYSVSFPMFAKIDVNGTKAAPLYKHLTSKEAVPGDSGPVKWNFEKFLVNREGKVVGRFRTSVEPEDPKLLEAIETALKDK